MPWLACLSAAAPLRRRAGVARFKELFGVASFVRMDLLFFEDLLYFVDLFFGGGCCAGGGALHLVALLADRAALWTQVRAERGRLHLRRHLSLRCVCVCVCVLHENLSWDNSPQVLTCSGGLSLV